ncbi:hypothetical protein GCM10009651_09750 [Microbacterium natoriense]
MLAHHPAGARRVGPGRDPAGGVPRRFVRPRRLAAPLTLPWPRLARIALAVPRCRLPALRSPLPAARCRGTALRAPLPAAGCRLPAAGCRGTLSAACSPLTARIRPDASAVGIRDALLIDPVHETGSDDEKTAEHGLE